MLLEFEERFFGRALAENKAVWIKERRFTTTGQQQQWAPEWSAKLLVDSQPRGQPLRFTLITDESKEGIVEKLVQKLGPLRPAEAQLDQYLSLTITRVLVSSVDKTTQCWIDSTCRTGGRSYYVTCGLRFREDRREDAVQLWSDHFGPLDEARALGAPSKVVVFSNIYSYERESDTVNIITPGKTFRHLNPLARGGLVLRTGGCGVNWAHAWCEYFRTSTKGHVLDRARQHELLEAFAALATHGLANLTALELLHLSPLQLCARVLQTPAATVSLDHLPADTQLALAGLCGLLRVWRMDFYFQRPLNTLGSLQGPALDRFLSSITTAEICAITADLDTLLLEPSAPASLQMISDHISTHVDFQYTLNRTFCAFQRAVLGSSPYIFTL